MGTRCSFPGSKAGGKWSWPFTFIECRSQRMSGAIHSLPQYVFMAWCLVKYRDNFTFTFTTLHQAYTLIRLFTSYAYECVSKNISDWSPGARTASGTALCDWEQLYRYFLSQSSEFCHHNPLCCFSTSVYCCKRIFRYDSARKLLDTPSYIHFLSLHTSLPTTSWMIGDHIWYTAWSKTYTPLFRG
jgi:hypothetical protein